MDICKQSHQNNALKTKKTLDDKNEIKCSLKEHRLEETMKEHRLILILHHLNNVMKM